MSRQSTSTNSQLGTTATPSIARETSRRDWTEVVVSEGHLHGVQVLQRQQQVQGAEQDVQESHQGVEQLKDEKGYETEFRGEERGPPLAYRKGERSSSGRAGSNIPVKNQKFKFRSKKQEEQEDEASKDQEETEDQEDSEVQVNRIQVL